VLDAIPFEYNRLLINLYANIHNIMLCCLCETPLLACLTGGRDTDREKTKERLRKVPSRRLNT